MTCVYVASYPVLHHSYHHLHYYVMRYSYDDSCGGGLGTKLVCVYTSVAGASWQYNHLLIEISLLVLEFRVHRLVELQKHVLAFKVITTLYNCIILVLWPLAFDL